MMPIRLDERLYAIGCLVDYGSVADIGCDHGKLSYWLIGTDRASKEPHPLATAVRDVFQRTDSMYVLYWLIGGGLFYSLGTIFFFLDKYKYMHSAWHLFVLGGTVCHFIAIYNLV